MNNETNISQSVASSVAYNTQGSVIFSRDPLGHQTTIGYADAFSTNGTNTTTLSFSTLAYPTMVTVADPDNFSSIAKYNYDLGMATRAQDPKGAAQTREYDASGRVIRITNAVNNAYTRWVYPSSQTIINKFTTINDLVNEAYSATVLDGAGRVRATASDFPATTPHYSGQYTSYDVMGRAVSQTNPIEMTGVWTATDADATAQGGFGWIFTTQTYDWKGRPMVTTNTDLTTKEASYGGCGCAGGEVVTLTDEGTVISSGGTNVAKKRQQRIYSDVLGRTIKAEVRNWDGAGPFGTGGTVYSATVNTYNARDQVTLVRQFQGTAPVDPNDLSCPSGTCQQSTVTYDGHGRAKTKHVPEQQADPNNPASTDHTTWDYNADDTVQKITDARGATATFGYNNRHLPTSITSGVPTGSTIPLPAAVGFGYDAAGNRTSMADGSGNTTYEYNTLSQVTSETRQFSGPGAPPGTYTLSYLYNLAGELKKITDPTNATINYDYDVTGRIIGVTGENTLYNGVSQYASGLAYRAWGGLKSMAYFNTTSLSLSYNQRGLVTNYSVGGVKLPVTGEVVPEGGSFQYYADGQPKFASDLRTDAAAFGLHDRAYAFDHVGRLKEAYSGTEARDFINGTSSGIFDGGFRQSYGYDAWSNLTARTGRFWSLDDNSSDSYNSQNRNPVWEYDSDGRPVSRNEPSPNGLLYQPLRLTYDAAGRRVQSTQTASRPHPNPNNPLILTTVTSRTETYDGDGVGVKSVATSQTNDGTMVTTSTFYLRSTVLGGRTISEYDASGIRQKAYIFAGGELLAEQERLFDGTTRLLWQHINPVTGDGLNTDAQGISIARATLDPMGVDMGDTDPFATGGGGGGEEVSQLGIDARVAQLIPGFCGPQVKLDGFITNPYLAFSALSSGAAVRVNPGANTTPRIVRFGGHTVLAVYRAFHDGFQGFIPNNAAYTSNGNFSLIGPPNPDGLRNGGRALETDFSQLNRTGNNELNLARSPEFFGPQNYAQQRQDLKGATKVPDINVKREYLTDCVQKYLAKFFGGQSLAGIVVKRDYLPPIAPNDARAFTNTGSLISFNKGEYQPNTKRGIELIGHEIAHIFQARKYGDAVFAALYLGDSAALLYQFKNLDMAYLGNRFEKEAFAKQAEIEKDLAKNGNPCPP